MDKIYIKSNKYTISERSTKNGKVYDIRFRVITENGAEVRKHLGGFNTKTLAKEAYTRFVTENCSVATQAIKADKKSPTLNEVWEAHYKSILATNKPNTVTSKKYAYDEFIKSTIGDKKLSQLDAAALREWQDNLWSMKNTKTGEPFAFEYLKRVRGILSSILSYAEGRMNNYINPMRKIPLPRRITPKPQMMFWTREEFDRFIVCVDDPVYRAFFYTLFFTGRRRGEVLALTPADVSLEKKEIKINKNLSKANLSSAPYQIVATKAGKVSSSPICAPLLKALKAYEYDKDGAFFFGGDKPLSFTSVTRHYDAAVEKAGVKRIRIHDFRHSFVSMLIHMGANMTVVADLISDEVEQVMQTYGHLYETDRKAIISLIK